MESFHKSNDNFHVDVKVSPKRTLLLDQLLSSSQQSDSPQSKLPPLESKAALMSQRDFMPKTSRYHNPNILSRDESTNQQNLNSISEIRPGDQTLYNKGFTFQAPEMDLEGRKFVNQSMVLPVNDLLRARDGQLTFSSKADQNILSPRNGKNQVVISKPGQPVFGNQLNGLTGKDLMKMNMSADKFLDHHPPRVLNTQSNSGLLAT